MEQDRTRFTQGNAAPAHSASRKSVIAPGEPRPQRRMNAHASPQKSSKAPVSEGKQGRPTSKVSGTSEITGDRPPRKENKPPRNQNLLSAEMSNRPLSSRPAPSPAAPPPPSYQQNRISPVTSAPRVSSASSPGNLTTRRDPNNNTTMPSTYEFKATKPVTKKPAPLTPASKSSTASKGEQSQPQPKEETKAEDKKKPEYPPTIDLDYAKTLQWIVVTDNTLDSGAKDLLKYINENNLEVRLSMCNVGPAKSRETLNINWERIRKYATHEAELQILFLCYIGGKPVYCNIWKATRAFLKALKSNN